MVGPFWIVANASHTAIIDENGTSNIVSTDLVTPGLSPKRVQKNDRTPTKPKEIN